MSGRLSCGLDRKQWGSLNILLGVLILKTQLLPLAAGLVERRGRQGGEGSDGPDASEGSLAVGGGCSGQGPAAGFARLAARLLQPESFPSQATHR